MTAAIAAIPNVAVPASLGYQVPLDGSGSNAASQTFSVTSSNPDIKVSIAQGPFMTLNLTHTASSTPGDVSFTGPVTFQLFNDLTPMTTAKFEQFVNSGYYNGKTLHRIAANFSGTGGPSDYVIQGGAPTPSGSGNSGQPGTPFGLELNQQVTFVNPGALAVAHTSAPNSNDTQFFFTTGPQTSLDYQYTDFGQVVAGVSTISKIEQVATQANAGLGGEKSLPISPVTITSATLSNTNPNGVIHIDATGAYPGETATVQVTATDPADHTTAVQTFQVTVVNDYTSPTNHPSTFTFSPVTEPAAAQVASGGSTPITFSSINGNPNNPAVTTQYQVVTEPSHGTLSALNATTGTAVYTPTPGFTGIDTFTFKAVNVGGSPSPLSGNIATATIDVGPTAPVNTGAVRIIGTVLVVDPPPTTTKAVNNILISEAGSALSPASQTLAVSLNGQTDLQQPLASSINRIIVFGGKASENIAVAPNVDPTIPVTLDGGHGGKNTIQGGAGPTREHGWFGQNTLIGGTGDNALVGAAGHVRFHPSTATYEIFAGVPHPGYTHFHSYRGTVSSQITPPGGTFYKFVHNKLVPISTPTRAKSATSVTASGVKIGTVSTRSLHSTSVHVPKSHPHKA